MSDAASSERRGRLTGKVAIVTGAARGMGAAEAALFASEGAVVYAVDILDDVHGLASAEIRCSQGDVTEESTWNDVVRAAETECGGVDILVNNAGIAGDPAAADALSLEAWDRIVRINQTASFLGIKHVVPAMRLRGGGSIVQISSTFSSRGVNGLAGYCSTKAAVAGLARSAAMSYVRENIRVNSLHPGLVDTPMTANEAVASLEEIATATPMGRAASPHEIAAAALFLASDESSFITGIELYVDGGYTACGQMNM